jgi:hypothetical protein
MMVSRPYHSQWPLNSGSDGGSRPAARPWGVQQALRKLAVKPPGGARDGYATWTLDRAAAPARPRPLPSAPPQSAATAEADRPRGPGGFSKHPVWKPEACGAIGIATQTGRLGRWIAMGVCATNRRHMLEKIGQHAIASAI